MSSNLFILRNCRLFCFCKTRNDTFRITKHIIFFIKSIHLQNHSTWIAPFLLRRQKTMFGSFVRVFFLLIVFFVSCFGGCIQERSAKKTSNTQSSRSRRAPPSFSPPRRKKQTARASKPMLPLLISLRPRRRKGECCHDDCGIVDFRNVEKRNDETRNCVTSSIISAHSHVLFEKRVFSVLALNIVIRRFYDFRYKRSCPATTYLCLNGSNAPGGSRSGPRSLFCPPTLKTYLHARQEQRASGNFVCKDFPHFCLHKVFHIQMSHKCAG